MEEKSSQYSSNKDNFAKDSSPLESNNNKNEEKEKFISEYDREEKKKLVKILKSLEKSLDKEKDESIIEVYSKFAKNSNDFLKKEINPDFHIFVKAFFRLLLIFYIYNVISIFISKNILDNLWIIIENSLVNIFEPKIEEPDSLFNYYSIFFKNSIIPSFNFDLMMIMNFLGDICLQSCGFRQTSISFFIINLISFLFIYIFNFIKYKEVGKYSLGQIICLILIYALFYIGVGSSSLLSQKVLVEFNQRYNEYIEEEKNEDTLEKIPNEELMGDEKLSKKNEGGIQNGNKNLRSFYIITFGTLLGYYFFWYNNFSSCIIQILEENKINNSYENIINITNTIDINLNTIRINDIYNKNKEIFFYFKYVNYAVWFIFSFIFYCLLLLFLKKRKLQE